MLVGTPTHCGLLGGCSVFPRPWWLPGCWWGAPLHWTQRGTKTQHLLEVYKAFVGMEPAPSNGINMPVSTFQILRYLALNVSIWIPLNNKISFWNHYSFLKSIYTLKISMYIWIFKISCTSCIWKYNAQYIIEKSTQTWAYKYMLDNVRLWKLLFLKWVYLIEQI